MNNFIIRTDDSLEGYGFMTTVANLFGAAELPVADEYSVNWSDLNFDIIIDSIEVDGAIVWQESTIDVKDWTENDDRLIEGLTSYIENNIV